MARKTHARKRSSCQVEHWWEKRVSYNKKPKEHDSHCIENDMQFIIRHMIEAHLLNRPSTPDDLRHLKSPVLQKLGLEKFALRFRHRGIPGWHILRHAYPEFFDYSRPDHVHEWDFTDKSRNRRKKKNAEYEAVRHMLEDHWFKNKVGSRDLLQVDGGILRQLGIRRPLRRFRNSPAKLLLHVYPEFFDHSQPDHIHEWDFQNQRNIWCGAKGHARALTAIRHSIECHHLGRPARPADLIPIGDTEFRRMGLTGMLSSKKFKRSPAAALRHAYPEFFDLSQPDHIHEWDFRQRNMWNEDQRGSLARTAVRHMIESHYLKRNLGIEELHTVATRRVLLDCDLDGLLANNRFRNSPLAVFRHAYPEFFDLSQPDHIHEWDFKQMNMWMGRKGFDLARNATRHMIEIHLLGRSVMVEDLPNLAKGETFERLGLKKMVDHPKFLCSPTAALRHAYPEFAESIGRRIKGTADFVEALESEDPNQARKLLRDLMSHFGDDLVDVADILAVVYTGRLESKTALEALRDPSMRPWIVPFDGRGHGPTKPPIDDEFPFYLLEKDQNGVIAGIISRRLTEWRRKVLGARPSAEARAKFLQQLREMQDKFQANGAKDMAPAA